MTYKFLIVTPLLNGAPYLLSCIKSVRRAFAGQHYRHVVVDAGSSDNPQSVIADENDPNVVLLLEQGSSIYEALNAGKRDYCFEWFYQLNVDDIILRSGVNSIVEAQKQHPGKVLVGGCISVYSEVHQFRLRFPIETPSIASAFLSNIYIPQPSAFIPKVVFSLGGDFSSTLKFAGDTRFWINAQERGVQFHYVREVVSIDRVGSLNARFSKTHQHELAELRKELRATGVRRSLTSLVLYVIRNTCEYARYSRRSTPEFHCEWTTLSGIMGFYFSLSVCRLLVTHPECRGQYESLGRLR